MTLNDLSVAKLISRGLVERLTDDEQAQLQNYLDASEQSRSFAELSAQIQRILSGAELTQVDPQLDKFARQANSSHAEEPVAQDAEPGPGLSQMSRARIARRLAEEMHADADTSDSISERDRSDYRMVAEEGTNYERETDLKEDDERN